MEVHHHSYSPSPNNHQDSRKKWSHYFWEFFMLFLAVTLGFFVENQREHLVEHKREKQYIQSMTVDLAADTTKLGIIGRHHRQLVNELDSILDDYETFSSGHYSQKFFTYQRALDGFTDFIYTDRTINQLKSSGGMRLIRKQAASDSIVAYDDDARDFLLEQQGLQRILNNMTDQQYTLVNYRLANSLGSKGNSLTRNTVDLLLTHDKVLVEGFFNTVTLYKFALLSKIIEASRLRNKATRLINFLNEQYHFN